MPVSSGSGLAHSDDDDMTTKQTRVSDVQRWWEYEYGYEWRFYESDDDRPTDPERADKLIQDLVVRDDENYGTRRGDEIHQYLEEVVTDSRTALRMRAIDLPTFRVAVYGEHVIMLPSHCDTELRQEKRYGDVLVSGTVDVLAPHQVIDWKTSAYAFKYDAYYRSLQWRFYLDMTGRDHFRYIGLQIRNPLKGTDEHRLTDIDELDCYAYAGMTDELTDKVERFAAFVDHECPEYWDIDIYGKD